MNSATAKLIPLQDFMEKIGYTPQKVNGVFWWYQSPFLATTQQTGSFKIDTSQNIWYDYSQGKGGKIIELVMQLQNCNVSTALQQLGGLFNANDIFLFAQQINTASKKQTSHNKIIVKKVKPLTNKALLKYLAERRISTEIATKYLVEVYYCTEKHKDKNYFAVGFGNDKGGYELRNRLYKAASSPKAITTIQGSSQNNKGVCIFEGFMDFLSCLEYYGTLTPKYDCLVLNTVGFAAEATERLKNYEKVFCFFDNDKAGTEAFTALQQVHPRVKDFSNLYKNHNDFNEFWLNYSYSI